jgi:N-acetylglucosamine-6-phosphate deacetylase
MSAVALVGARVFDGARLLEGRAVVIDAGRISRLVPDAEVPHGIPTRRVEGLIAPGFIDTQVNGGGGVLFNDARTVDGIAAIGAAHRRFGTTGFLPTFITDTRERMAEAVAAVDAAIAANVPGVLGIHVEGPFINPARKGAHDAALVRAIEDDDVAILMSLKSGRTLVTLAPEMVPAAIVARLAAAGCLVSAGHTEATYEQMSVARAAGLSGVTHLFNAMPPLAGRAPGVVGAALDDAEAYVSIIADLVHVSAPSLRVAIAARGFERMLLVSDAMPSVGSAGDTFLLNGRTVTRRDGRLTLPDGTLAGSDLDMAAAVRNTVNHLGLPVEAALRMASRAPAEFLGLGGELGRIAPGYRASLVLLDDDLHVQATWVDGIGDQNAEARIISAHPRESGDPGA